jgi:hypothetical protein
MGIPNSLDWQWAQRTDGNLTLAQKRALAATVARLLPALATGELRRRFGRRGDGALDFATVRLPDTAPAKEAERAAADALSPQLLQHSYRSYYFGRVLAGLDRVDYDDELGYVACLLHDLALEHPTPGRCFAVVGARRAVDIVRGRMDPDRLDALGAAIAGHITPGAADDLGDPAGFVSAGAGADVFGGRIAELDPAWVDDLLLRHPRQDFAEWLEHAWRRESRAVPDGRAAWMSRYAAFTLLIRHAPFPK